MCNSIYLGNTSRLWPHFLDFLEESKEIPENPLDLFVRSCIYEATNDLATQEDVFFASDTRPDRLIATQVQLFLVSCFFAFHSLQTI